MISLLLFVIAVVLFLVSALGFVDLLFWGLAAFAAAHIPWGDFNVRTR